jgi:D-glycero-D-manno-heptose 1,7-bisphosphate phosphatase
MECGFLKSPPRTLRARGGTVPDTAPDSERRPALFLDRDGVLNEDHGYVSRWEDFSWIPGAKDAVAASNQAGWLVIVVTNQSGVGRGYYTEADMHALHQRMAEELAAAGGRIDGFYFAPHHPEAAAESYRHPDPPDRKPNPGMILRALADWPIDAARSVLVGDKASDMEAAKRAGIRGLRFKGGDLRAFLVDEAKLIS